MENCFKTKPDELCCSNWITCYYATWTTKQGNEQKENVCLISVFRLQEVLKEYDDVVSGIPENVLPLMKPFTSRVDETIKPGLTMLNWTSLNVYSCEYLKKKTKSLKLLAVLNTLVIFSFNVLTLFLFNSWLKTTTTPLSQWCLQILKVELHELAVVSSLHEYIFHSNYVTTALYVNYH